MGNYSIERQLSAGKNLSSILDQHGFHPFCIGLIRSGEATGDFLTSLESIHLYLDKKIKLKKKLKKSLTYPIIVSVTAILVLLVIFQWVVPTFEIMFSNFNTNLPWPTQLLIQYSKWLQVYFLYAAFGLVSLICSSLVYWKQSASFQKRIDRWMLSIPIWGKIRTCALVSQWAKNIATLSGHGIPILEALKETATNSNDWVIFHF